MKFLNTKSGSVLRMSIVAALFAMGANAQASSFIVGTIDLSGAASNLKNGNPLVVPAAGGTALSFGNTAISTASAPIGYTPTGGDLNLASGSVGTSASVANIIYNPLQSTPFTLYTTTVGGNALSFIVTSVTAGDTYITNRNIFLDGIGYFKEAGYTSTVGSWSLSYSGTNGSNSWSGGIQTYSTIPPVAATPLPAALFFVAPALAGVFGFSRRKNGAKLAA